MDMVSVILRLMLFTIKLPPPLWDSTTPSTSSAFSASRTEERLT